MRTNILITGASSGLGAGMAREFAAKGHNLALCSRRLETLEALKQELLAAHPDIQIYTRSLDVDNHEQVFEVFRAFQQDMGNIDRIIVNAGVAHGAKVGTGQFEENRKTAVTNFVSALAQCEAAVEIFREQNHGHLVAISSLSAMRGLPGSIAVYAATKAGLALLAEGIRADLLNTPIKVTTIYPGYILTPLNEHIKNAPFRVDVETGCKAMVKAIDKEPDEACVPPWPWKPLSYVMKWMPLKQVAKMA
ncbi:MAG: SDR family oxidoreductase [Salinisphaeraceae bacterium]|nr:SDR family oxidoreductase [Salinisphaeraceae bacterium]